MSGSHGSFPVVFENVSFAYRQHSRSAASCSHIILDNISFSMRSGGVIGILGRNGSGKTTILNIASGLLDKYSGSVRICGEDIRCLRRRDLAMKIAYVRQLDPFIPEYYRIDDFILEGRRPFVSFGRYRKSDFESMENAIGVMGLDGLRDRKVSQVSGGERQRAVLARAIAKGARINFFDEPCSAMDISNYGRFFTVIRKISHDSGALSVVTIHDINLAIRYCDRLMVLSDGKICFFDKAELMSADVLHKAYGVKFDELLHSGRKFYLVADCSATPDKN